MGGSEKRWIVLLDKSPKGPLSEEDIRTLIDQKVLRRNDLAYLLPLESKQDDVTEWKLLWQFPEFDQRSPDSKLEVPAERRSSSASTPDSQKILGAVPNDLIGISPEELVPRASQIGPVQADVPSAPINPSPTRASAPSLWWAGLAGMFVLAGVSTWLWMAPEQPSTPIRTPAESVASPLTPPISRETTYSRPKQRHSLQPPRPAAETSPTPLKRLPDAGLADSGEVLPEDSLEGEESDEFFDEEEAESPPNKKASRETASRSIKSEKTLKAFPKAQEDEEIEEPSEDLPEQEE